MSSRLAPDALRILQVTGGLSPEFGGPPAVVNQLTRSLLRLDHEVEVLTLDSPTDPWLAECPGVVHALGPSYGKYRFARPLPRSLAVMQPTSTR